MRGKLNHSFMSMLVLILLGFVSQNTLASSPYLAFSDLISGPDVGLGDGKGSGVIVTLWAQNAGSFNNSTSKVYFTDSLGVKREAAHVYYWKNADGALPSGPANLFASHKMQEIAFSIPDSAMGLGSIHIENGSNSNSLPFTVRSGNIYHIKSTGNDSSGNGSYSSPWRTLDSLISSGGANRASSGSTIYLHDVDSGSTSSYRGIYWNNGPALSGLGNQFGIIAYPNFHPKAIGQNGIEPYNTEGLVVSKIDVYSSNYKSVDANDQPTGGEINSSGVTIGIKTTKNGRTIANRIGDIPGGCASKTQGAISGSSRYNDYVSNHKIIGNEVYDYGCAGTSKLHHTTYMSIRSAPDNEQLPPWEFGYNYLHGNKAKFGIHQFDQDTDCGNLTAPIRIYNNVVIDQAGAGISVGSQCDWSMDTYIENNIIINSGLPADWDGINESTTLDSENGGISIRDSGLLGTMYIRNNLIYDWNKTATGNLIQGCLALQGSEDNVTINWSNNICITSADMPFMGTGYQSESKVDNVIGNNNVWFDGAGSPSNDSLPSRVLNSLVLDPGVTIQGSQVVLSETSSVIDVDNVEVFEFSRDIYGNLRDSKPDIGPVEFISGEILLSPAKSPANFIGTPRL